MHRDRGRAVPVVRQHQRGEHGRGDQREVEQRVVEREHPAAELVLDVLLDERVDADLDALRGEAEQQRGEQQRGQRVRQPQREVDDRGRGEEHRPASGPARTAERDRRDQRGQPAADRDRGDDLGEPGQPGAEDAVVVRSSCGRAAACRPS